MKRFKDNSGRDWIVAVNVTSIKLVRDLAKVDLLEIATDNKGTLLEKLATDPITLCDVLYCLCKEQCDKQGVSDVQFGEGLAGDAIDAATQALLEDLVDFFPAGKRRLLTKAVEKLNRFLASVDKKALERLESGEVEALFEKILTKGLQESNA